MTRNSESWRSVIRVFATTIALLGLVLIAHEIVENIASCSANACTRLHLATMLWGITLLSLGLLILQKGDVSMSLQELTAAGTVVRSWWGRRAYDRKSAKVAAVTEETTTVVVVDDATPAPTDLPTTRDD